MKTPLKVLIVDDNRSSAKLLGRYLKKLALWQVEDNGIGISPRDQKRVFEIFHRLNPKSGNGEGLGLNIVNKIINRHRGKVWVESEPDKGSKFFISLPA